MRTYVCVTIEYKYHRQKKQKYISPVTFSAKLFCYKKWKHFYTLGILSLESDFGIFLLRFIYK